MKVWREQLRLLTIGRERARAHQRMSRAHAAREGALHELASWATSPSEDEPVFIFAVMWRSGSTLLQRVVASGGKVLVWGEPYADALLVPRLGRSLQPFSRYWPEKHYVRAGDELSAARLTAENIENLYPHPLSLIEAHLAFYDTLYGQPARVAGYERWGFKETRLGADDARYLRFLYPHAKLLVLVRNPVDAWASYRRWAGWYLDWPENQVRTPQAFALNWARLAGGLHATAGELDAMIVRYEDLSSDPQVVQRVADHVDVALDRAALEHRTHTSRAQVPRAERLVIERLTGSTATAFGY